MDHDWIFIATIPVTRSEIDRAVAGETLNLKDLGLGQGIRDQFAGCYRCEQPVSAELLGSPCPGDPTSYDEASGEPHHG